ncbi:MAG: hypothetical protein J7M19_05780, partial [Planctomycetes bacterium]|nr:hypothetical protein [Planctomycetota bacterium]
RRQCDPEFEELWSNAVWIFLEAVCRLDLAKRPGRLVQKLVNDTASGLGTAYRRARDRAAVEIPTDPSLLEALAGALRQVQAANRFQEYPDRIRPEFLELRVALTPFDAEGLETRPEDDEKNRPPTVITVRGMRRQDWLQHFVLLRVLRGTGPHEADHIAPRGEVPQERMFPLQLLKKRPVLLALDSPLKLLTLPVLRKYCYDALPFRPGVWRLTEDRCLASMRSDKLLG